MGKLPVLLLLVGALTACSVTRISPAVTGAERSICAAWR